MKKLVQDFYDRYFHDEESIILLLLLTVGLTVLLTLGGVLAPLMTAIIVAYLMQGLVNALLKYGLSGRLAFVLVYVLFIGLFLVLLFFLLPQAWNQLRRLIGELPNLLSQWQASLMLLPDRYPSLFSESQIQEFILGVRGELGGYGQVILEYSLASIPGIIDWVIFLILVPILVFFVMKDKAQLIDWAGNFLPRNRPLMSKIWHEMDQQISNYVRGKGLEIIIVGLASFLLFRGVGAQLRAATVGVGRHLGYRALHRRHRSDRAGCSGCVCAMGYWWRVLHSDSRVRHPAVNRRKCLGADNLL